MRRRSWHIRLAGFVTFLLLAQLAAAVTATQAGAVGASDWLGEANYLRGFWNVPVPALTEDSSLSANDQAHDHYLDENKTCGHTEDTSNPYYSDAGEYGGQHSVVYCAALGPKADVDGWVGTMLHGEQVLNPQLTTVGFAETHLNGGHAAMDTLTHYADADAPSVPATWPNGDGFPLTEFSGGEYDYTGGDAVVDNCPAAYANANALGAPLFVDLPGSAHNATPSAASDVWLRADDGTADPVCLYDADSPVAPFESTAVLLPLHPFTRGTHYTASYTAGGQTATWSFTVASDLPGVPSDVAVTSVGNRSATIAWTAPNDNGTDPVTGYDVQYSSDGGTSWTSASTAFHGDTATSQKVSGLTDGTQYRFRVAAVNDHGTGAYSSASASVTPQASVPGTPTGVTAAPGDSQATVRWTRPSDDGGSALTGYDVQFSTDNGTDWTSAPPPSGTSTVDVVDGLVNGTSYVFRVAATNAEGTSDYSASSSPVVPRVDPDRSALSITAPTAVTYPRVAAMATRLTDSSTAAPIGGAQVALFERSTSSRVWTRAGGAVTDAAGRAAVRLRPARNMQFEWRFAGASQHAAATSAVRVVDVAPSVSARLQHPSVRRQHRIVLSGVVRPSERGRHAVVQLYRRHAWRDVGIDTTLKYSTVGGASGSSYSVVFYGRSAGTYLFRVRVAATATNRQGFSPPVRLKIT